MRKSAPKKKHSSKRLSSKVALGLVALGILLGLILLGKTINVLGALSKPYLPDAPIAKEYSWDSQEALNIVVKADKVYVLSLNPVKREGVILKIPDNTFTPLPFNFGSWKIASVYPLGQGETPKIGAKLLKDTLTLTLGVPVGNYLLLGKSDQSFDKILFELKANPLKDATFLGQIKTDLSFIEYWQMIFSLRGIRSDKIKVLDLGQSTLTSWQLLPDGERVLVFNTPQLDQFIQKYFENPKLKDEDLAIGIYNTTQHSGLGERASRIITNLGGRVAFVANFPQSQNKSLVLGEKSYTASYLSKIFSAQKVPPKDFIPDTSRAEVNLFLGEDWFLRYNSP